MRRRTVPGISGLLVAGLLVTGCAGGGGGGEQAATGTDAAQIPTGAEETSGTTDTASPTSAAPSTQPQSSGGAVDELTDGTWQVGEAGEVEFALQDGALSLTEVRPADGWQQRVAGEDPDEIEVHLTRDATDWKFEVEVDGDMEISKELEIKGAESGTYQVGDAAEVSFDTDGSTVSLGDVRTNDGWAVTKQDESTDDIEIDFRNDGTGASAEFEAEVDGGQVGLEIDQKLTGPIPG